MTKDNLVQTIRDFILASFLPGEKSENLPPTLNLIQSGILDSFALVETATFLEELSGSEIEAHELTPENVGSIAAMAAFVHKRRAVGP